MTVEPTQAAPYIFLSYAGADRVRALHLADRLEPRGVSVWIDRKSIAGGTWWSAEIVEGIKGCAALLALITPAAVQSRNVQQEIQLAWEHERKLLPILVERSQLPSAVEYALAGRQWVEMLDQPEAIWLTELVRALQVLGVPSQDAAIAVARDASPALAPSETSASATATSAPHHNLPFQVASLPR
ncbi:MAG TPA: toll/interleukin-1 receptor domain-containing protein [Chloroflexota bacterium]|nr:toll/interleukin-1 receptor domain-containing protein [Chloroflexota bacterium]